MLSILPKITAGLLVSSAVAEVTPLRTFSLPLQYGALGLCAMMMWGTYKILCEHKKEREGIVAELQKKDRDVAELIKTNTSALNRMAEALEDKPCLAKDSRIIDPKGG